MSMTSQADETKKGLFFALLCYIQWGLFPLYWYPLKFSEIGSDQILAQRIIWSALFTILLMLFSQQKSQFWQVWKNPKLLLMLCITGLLLASNWLIYLWSITHNRVLDASLGYFINPLVNVFLGYLFLKERISPLQILAIICAAIGIVWLIIPIGEIPWIALLLASSFGFYGLIRKCIPVSSLVGLSWETLILLPLSFIYLQFIHQNGWGFQYVDTTQTLVLLGSGVVTTLPLLCFTASAKRIPLSILGITQYLSPTLQMFLGLILFHETLSIEKWIAYSWVWLGVLIYSYTIWRQS